MNLNPNDLPRVDELPPHSLEAERGILACVLLSPNENLPRVTAKLGRDATGFYDLRHQEIFKHALALQERHVAVDEITVIQALRDAGVLEQAGGIAYLSELPDAAPSAPAVDPYLDIVIEKWRLRQTLGALAKSKAAIDENGKDAGEVLTQIERDILQAVKGARPLPVARPLSALAHEDRTAGELLRFRYLCRGAGLLLCGPTGIGKSSLAMQFALSWAVGRSAFGIQPAAPLKSLLVQAENDDGDLSEMRDGATTGLRLPEADAGRAADNVIVVQEDERTGARFFSDVLHPLLQEHKPDLLWIDPVLAYLGGEANAQKDVGGFLRNRLNPLLHEFGCAGVVIHHTNKPPTGRERSNWQAGDFAYLASGSAEWANWPRAVLALRSIGSHDVFELRAGKRGGRLAWREPDGQTRSFVRYLAHAIEPGVIYWREVSAEDVDRPGRPKSYDVDELLALLPAGGLTTSEWVKAAHTECGVSEATLHRERRALEKAGRILKSKVSGKWLTLKNA